MKVRKVLAWMIPLCALIVASGCSIGGWGTSKPSEGTPSESQAPETAKKPTASYLDFEDIIIPMELSAIKERTVIVSTPGFKSGILTLKGRVDSTSLFNFFSNNMEKDNWQVVSKIKSPGTTIMVFRKTARCAVITIRDDQLYTYVEIGVAPTLGGQTFDTSGNLTE